MDGNTINQNFNLLELAEMDTTLKRVGSYFVGPCPFCGGRDRFTLKATKNGFRWYCRKCGGGKYLTAIDYVMRRENLDFKTALNWCGGDSQALTARPRTEPSQIAITLPGEEWKITALRKVELARNALEMGVGNAQTGRDYLYQRGIDLKSTASVWRIGFSPCIWDGNTKSKRPAIVIPWWELTKSSTGPSIFAIKYRFVSCTPNSGRYTSLNGGTQVLYGLWDVLECHTILLLVEGEFNALSIWQMHPQGVTILSFGSEGATRAEILKAIASRYKKVFVWADDPVRALKLRDILPGSVAIQSPIINCIKWDANQMLISRLLSEFLEGQLEISCKPVYIG
ncbi:MAG: primase-helicase zinc-binding domain-containing protein [Chloroflexota bacterium]